VSSLRARLPALVPVLLLLDVSQYAFAIVPATHPKGHKNADRLAELEHIMWLDH